MKIKIISTPMGTAPLSVRQAWIGIELPLADRSDVPIIVKNVLPGDSESPSGLCYSVLVDDAIKTLEHYDPIAHAWWRAWRVSPFGSPTQVYTNADQFSFDADVCELIA